MNDKVKSLCTMSVLCAKGMQTVSQLLIKQQTGILGSWNRDYFSAVRTHLVM